MQNDINKAYADECIKRAQQSLSQQLWLDPSLDTALTFLLMSFYMLLTHRRNAAYTHVGYAVRCAHALGFHRLQRTDEAERSKSRVWRSIYVMDLMICSVLGRPSGSDANNSSDSASTFIFDGIAEPGGMFLDQAFRVSAIVNEAYRGLPLEHDQAEAFLKRLTAWRESLPPNLRTTIHPTLGSKSNTTWARHVIAKMYLACSYYHGVILITRPFLMLDAERHGGLYGSSRRSRVPDSGGTADIPSSTTVEKLAEVCLDAATYSVETLHETWQTGALLAHMCFTK